MMECSLSEPIRDMQIFRCGTGIFFILGRNHAPLESITELLSVGMTVVFVFWQMAEVANSRTCAIRIP